MGNSNSSPPKSAAPQAQDGEKKSVTGVNLAYSKGRVFVQVGARFHWWDGTDWEVVSFTGARMYSPSGLGGTPIVRCKHIGGTMPPGMVEYVDSDGICEWCGDSVASGVANTAAPIDAVEEQDSTRSGEEHPSDSSRIAMEELQDMIQWSDGRAQRCSENPAWNINVERYTKLSAILRAALSPSSSKKD